MGGRDSPPQAPDCHWGQGRTTLQARLPREERGFDPAAMGREQKPCHSCATLLPMERSRPCQGSAAAFPAASPSARPGPRTATGLSPALPSVHARKTAGRKGEVCPMSSAIVQLPHSSSSRGEDEDVPAFLHPTSHKTPCSRAWSRDLGKQHRGKNLRCTH